MRIVHGYDLIVGYIPGANTNPPLQSTARGPTGTDAPTVRHHGRNDTMDRHVDNVNHRPATYATNTRNHIVNTNAREV